MFKLWFFTSPETSLKQVFLEFSIPFFFSLVLGYAIFIVRK
jgi:hypothetical protein